MAGSPSSFLSRAACSGKSGWSRRRAYNFLRTALMALFKPIAEMPN
jgi:hypothetical protein